MIEQRTGDLLKQDDIHVIIHQANCFHTMGGGIAKKIKDLYPNAYIADCKTKRGDINKLGTYSVAGKNPAIVNMYSQYRYGTEKRHTDYDAMRKALTKIFGKLKEKNKQVKVGVPHKMGCVLGGGDWDVVYKILTDIFETDENITLVICKYG